MKWGCTSLTTTQKVLLDTKEATCITEYQVQKVWLILLWCGASGMYKTSQLTSKITKNNTTSKIERFHNPPSKHPSILFCPRNATHSIQRTFCSTMKTYAALLTWWIHCIYGVMGLGLKSRNSQNYVGQPLLVPVPMPVPVRVHGSIKMSAIVAPKKIVVAPTTFSPVKDRFPFPGIHYRCSLRQMLYSTLVNRTFLYLSRSLSSPLYQKR